MDLNVYHKLIHSEIGLENTLQKNVEKMDVDFALAVSILNCISCRLESIAVPAVNILFMISPAVGLIMVVSVVFSGFH